MNVAELWQTLDGLPWLLVALLPLIFFQRALHRELQAVFLLLTRRADISIALFSLILFPGVLLHELSHFVMAKVLRVRTGKFSLVPRSLGDGRLLMGYVETDPSDFLRDALIGAAPLLAGGVFVAYAGSQRLGLLSLWGDFSVTLLVDAVLALFAQPDFWLWFYLTLAVSSTMLPSSADRRAWPGLVLVLIVVSGLALLVGAGPWMLMNLAPGFNGALRAVAVVFGISGAIHFVVLVPVYALRRLLSRIFGLDVV